MNTPESAVERREQPRRGAVNRLQDPVYRGIRWAGDHVRGFYAVLGVYLVVGLIAAGAALGLFALLAEVVFGGTVQSVDDGILHWMRTLESPFLDLLALIGVGLGSQGAAWIFIALGTLFLWRSRHRYSVYLLWLSVGGARVLNMLLKDWYDRPRPSFFRDDLEILGRTFDFPTSPSFPSGHALTSTVIFFTLAYLVARLERTRRMRRITFVACGFVVAMVCLSRVYLGVHYPSDVLAGFLVGVLWSTVVVLGIEVLRYFRTREPELAAEEEDLEKGVEPIREALPS